MKVRIKRLDERAVVPSYSKQGDAGMDLTAISVKYNEKNDYIEYDSGVSVEIPEGYVGLVFPRSSISNYDLMLTNAVGVIDSGYRSTIKARFKLVTSYEEAFVSESRLQEGWFEAAVHPIDVLRNELVEAPIYEIGERFAQLIILPYPKIEFKVVDELSSSERGQGGYGSTNNN